MRNAFRALALAAAVALAPAALASSHRSSAFTDAEVRKVDRAAGKVTLKHGPIANLEMPAMTMVFQVKDPAMLDKLKAGDKVKFKADNVQGAYTVTELAPAAR
jgi:Cu/Ag efflux protein CusF